MCWQYMAFDSCALTIKPDTGCQMYISRHVMSGRVFPIPLCAPHDQAVKGSKDLNEYELVDELERVKE